ncbi:hypothetical protein Trydic_g2747 [Trypoxylus dichotomus]
MYDVGPLLTYAAEIRDTTKVRDMVRAAKMKILSTIKGVTLRDQIRDKVIREGLEIQGIVRFTRMKRRFWRDHVDRITEGQ